MCSLPFFGGSLVWGSPFLPSITQLLLNLYAGALSHSDGLLLLCCVCLAAKWTGRGGLSPKKERVRMDWVAIVRCDMRVLLFCGSSTPHKWIESILLFTNETGIVSGLFGIWSVIVMRLIEEQTHKVHHNTRDIRD